MKPQTGFSADVGDKSIGVGGPDQIENDFQLIQKMFDPNATHTTNESGGIKTENLNSNIVTDTILGNRTVDVNTSTAYANTGTLTQILSWLAKVIKSMTGKANWYDAPTKTIEQLNTDKVETMAFNTHRTSTDHDSRYYTESEVNTLLNSINSTLSSHYLQIQALNTGYANLDSSFSTDAERIAAINSVLADLDDVESDLITAIGLKANQNSTYTKTEVDGLLSAFVTAENARAIAESTRNSNESNRVSAENTRVSNENTRISNESARVTAENSRISIFNDIVDTFEGMMESGSPLEVLDARISPDYGTFTTLGDRLDNIEDLMVTGSPQELLDARVSANYGSFSNLKDRLDDLEDRTPTIDSQSIGSIIVGSGVETSPSDGDFMVFADISASNIAKKITWSSVKSALSTYFGNVYQALLVSGTNINSLYGKSILGSGNFTFGTGTVASGTDAFSEGTDTVASGASSHAEGDSSESNGEHSHAEGYLCIAEGPSSHAEGAYTMANGEASHTEGKETWANGIYSHTEGMYSYANGKACHAEGSENIANCDFSHAEGEYSLAGSNTAHAEGRSTTAASGTAYQVIEFDNTLKTLTLDNVTGLAVNDKVVLWYSDTTAVADVTIDNINGFIISLTTTVTLTASLDYVVKPSATLATAHAEGMYTLATGQASHAEGTLTCAFGMGSHTEGGMTEATGLGSHAEGQYTLASGDDAHAEGYSTYAIGDDSHAEGGMTSARGEAAHAEGYITVAGSDYSHSEGSKTLAMQGNWFRVTAYNNTTKTLTLASVTNLAVNDYVTLRSNTSAAIENVKITNITGLTITVDTYMSLSASIDYVVKVSGGISPPHSEGLQTLATGGGSHAEGYGTVALDDYAHAEGSYTTASGNSSHAEGRYSIADSEGAHAEGKYAIAVSGTAYTVTAFNDTSKTLTLNSVTGLAVDDFVILRRNNGVSYSGIRISAINSLTITVVTSITLNAAITHVVERNATGPSPHCEGTLCMASGDAAHAEGYNSVVTGQYAHVEGADGKATGTKSHAEGGGTTASGSYAHSEGSATTASGSSAHSEGWNNTASGAQAHAEGVSSTASGDNSHSQNDGTLAQGHDQTAIGMYNVGQGSAASHVATDYAFIIGNGASAGARSNALSIDFQGLTVDSYMGPTGDSPFNLGPYSTDFLNATSPKDDLWLGAAISSGTQTMIAGVANHMGLAQLKSSTTTNSGYYWMSQADCILLAGGETTEFVFKVDTTANSTIRLGFQDSLNSTAPVDGLFINIAGTSLTFKSRSNNTETSTPAYTITQGTWYRARIVLDNTATNAYVYLYTADGTLVWSPASITTYIPTATGREVGHGVVATNSGTTAVTIITMDFMNLYSKKKLVR